MKRGIVLATLVVALLGVTASAQETEYLIASWENQMDHFGTGTDFDDSGFLTDIGVTEGSYALYLDFMTGWHQGLRSAYVEGLDPDFEPFFPQLEAAEMLRLDVTSNRTLFNNPSGSGAAQFALFMQGQAGGTPAGFNTTYSYELIMPTYYPESTYSTDTIHWDLTVADPLPHFGPETGGWFDMRIHTNVSGITDPGIVVIDNLRSVQVEGGGPVTGLGDFTGNGVVDTADYTTWADNFGDQASDFFFAGSYVDPDHTISTADYTTWADNFGNQYVVDLPTADPPGGTLLNPAMVPEPATMALLGLGVVGLLRRRR